MSEHKDVRTRAVEAARDWIGTPYRHQASLAGVGADCLGLVRGVWRTLFGAEPEIAPAYSPFWAEECGRELLCEALGRHLKAVDIEDATPGDVLVFRFTPWAPAKHAAILTGPDRIVHAYAGHQVAETAMGPWWRRRRSGAFRFPVEPS